MPPALAALVFETQEQLEELRDGGGRGAALRAEVERLRDELDGAARRRSRAELEARYAAWDAADAAAPPSLDELKRRLSEIAYLRTLLDDVDEALGSGLHGDASSASISGRRTAWSPCSTTDGPRVLPDPETGERLLPSAVALPARRRGRGRPARARALAAERPFDTILSVKRFMGLGLEHVTDEDRRRYRFADGGDGRRSASRVGGRERDAARGLGVRPARAQALGRGGARRAGRAGRDHRARLLQRQPAPGDARTPAGSPGSRCCAS